MLPTLVTSLLVHLFISFFTGDYHLDIDNNLNVSPPLKFELRHLHAVSSSSATVLFSDVSSPELLQTHTLSDPSGSTKATYSIHTNSIKTHRPSSFASFSNARLRSLRFGKNEWVDWEEDEILGPNVDNRETLLELAKMTNNAYLEPDETGWYALNGTWNVVRLSPFPIYLKMNQTCSTQSFPFGWEPESDGFRGHVFATSDNSTVIVSIKGTSAGVFGGGGPTAKKDRFNDNLLFSCCCARIDWTWSTVCGCYRGGWKCHQDCLEEALITESLFYPIGIVRILAHWISLTILIGAP